MLIKAVFFWIRRTGVIMMGYLLATEECMKGRTSPVCLLMGGSKGRNGELYGGPVHEEIASPVASEPEFAVLMNNPSLFRFQNQVQSGGTIFLNSSMIESRPIRGDLEIFEIPVNDLAKELKANKATNMIMLGAFIKKSGWSPWKR